MSELVLASVHSSEARWWLPEFASERYKKVVEVSQYIRQHQSHWRKRNLLHAHLYGNLPILGFGPSSYARIEPDDGRLNVSLVKSKIDTYVSLICRSKPKPMFLTSNTSSDRWSMRRRAQGLERWAEAKLYEAGFYDKVSPLAVLDSAIFDYGWAQVNIVGVDGDDWSNADIEIERVPNHEIVIDDAEAIGGRQRNVFRRKWVDRFVAAAMFPKQRAQILDCPKQSDDDDWSYDDSSDQVLITEAWHLPSGPSKKDGRHVVAILNATLIDEPYTSDKFAGVPLTMTPVAWGIRGVSIAAQLRPLQIFLNQAYIDMQDAVGMMSRPKWLIPRQGNIAKAHVDDEVASIIEYDHPFRPEAYAPASIPADLWQITQDIWHKADEVIGISSYASGGVVPSNLKSGRAQEVALDTRDGRFLMSSRLHEEWTMDLVERAIDAARIVAENRKDYAGRYVRKRFVEVVNFREVDMKRDDYVMKVYPASALANSPGARYDQLQDMLDRGVVDMATFKHLLDFPDLEGENKLLDSPIELADRLIERFLNAEDPASPDVYIAPEPSWPLQALYSRFLFTMIDAQNDGAPDANIELLRRFNAQIEFYAQKIGLALPGMPPPGAGPQATAAPASVPGQGPPMTVPQGAGGAGPAAPSAPPAP